MDKIEQTIIEMKEKGIKGCYFINKPSVKRIVLNFNKFKNVDELTEKNKNNLINVFGIGLIGTLNGIPIVFNKNRNGVFKQTW